MPVTGRRFSMAVRYAETLGLQGLMVFQNGAVIKDVQSRLVVYARGLPRPLAGSVIRDGRALGFSPMLFAEPETGGSVFIEDGPAQHRHLDRYLVQGWNDVRLLPRFEAANLPEIIQVLFCGHVAEMEFLRGWMDRRYGGDVKLLLTEYAGRDLSLLDVMAPDVSKGDALAFVGGLLGVPPSAMAAIGDNYNDVDMLDLAALPLLMANAPESLKRRFPRLLPDHNRSGAAWGIWRHVLKRPDRLREWFGPAASR